jgi:spore maturation protein CgeB
MYFKKNIEILKTIDTNLSDAIIAAKKDKDLQILTSKTGIPSLKAGHITIHSLYDPIKEAEEWVEHHKEKIKRASSVVVLGFGLGYHIMELCKLELLKVSEIDVVVFEPRIDILRTALEAVDLTSILKRVKIITSDETLLLTKGFKILEHKPSVTISRGYFEKILLRLKALQRVKNGLKIMVVGPIYGGSLPIARYCVAALKKLGHTVDFVDCSIYKDAFLGIDKITDNKMHQNTLKIMFNDFASETIVARCAEFKPDLIFALAQAPLNENSLKKFKDNKIPTAFWFVEDFRLMDYWQRVAPLYDYFFTIQRSEFFDKLKVTGASNFHYIPLAACLDIHKKLDLSKEELDEYGSDISFVGAGYYNRRNFFRGLLDFDFKIWGSEWDMNSPLAKCIQYYGKRIETEEIVKIFNATKININLHSSTYHEGINPYGDFVNPRTFEIAACEGFQIVDNRYELPELFRIGEEIVCFEDIEDLRHKIKYYLNNPDKMLEIAKKGRERVERDHTYEQRMEEILDFIVNRGYEPPPWPTEMEDVAELIERAGRDTELGRYLSRFLDKESISLSDIVEEIKQGEGSLSTIEKIFLLMDELKKQFSPKNR